MSSESEIMNPCLETCRVSEEKKDELYHAIKSSFSINPTFLPTTSTKSPILFSFTEPCPHCENQVYYTSAFRAAMACVEARTKVSTETDASQNQLFNDYRHAPDHHLRFYLGVFEPNVMQSRFSEFIKKDSDYEEGMLAIQLSLWMGPAALATMSLIYAATSTVMGALTSISYTVSSVFSK